MAASAFRFQGLSPKFLSNFHKVSHTKGGVGGRHGPVVAAVLPRRFLCHSVVRLQQVTSSSDQPVVTGKPAITEKHAEKILRLELMKRAHIQEKFIPITRRSVVRHLMQEEHFLNASELEHYDELARRLDSAVVNSYHGLLQELKALFDPINPDKDTITTRDWNRKERLDTEFWLMNKLSHVMSKANFTELRREAIEEALREHEAREGVLVSVNPNNYDILRMWVLGREVVTPEVSGLRRLTQFVNRAQAPRPRETYKRVVIAIRLKRDDKLTLKAFKDVPCGALEQLLPDGRIKMTQLTNVVITSSIGLSVLGLVAKFVTYMSQLYIQWTLLVTAVAALTAVRAWTVYKNRRHAYVSDLNRMLYYANIANNRGLLALLVDRAEDELFKEALLAYTFLLTNRAPTVGRESSEHQAAHDLGNLNRHELEQRVEDWVYKKTKTNVRFDSSDAVRLLTELELVRVSDSSSSSSSSSPPHGLGGADSLVAVPLAEAIRSLPVSSQARLEREEESDIVEGYDREAFDRRGGSERETRRRKYGWF